MLMLAGAYLKRCYLKVLYKIYVCNFVPQGVTFPSHLPTLLSLTNYNGGEMGD